MLTLKASLGSYAVFCGVWIVLALGDAALTVLRPGTEAWKGALVTGIVATACLTWMSGHRVRVSSTQVEYRDGLFRSRTIPRKHVVGLTSTWAPLRVLGREIKVPRLTVVSSHGAESFQINPKPFSRRSLSALHEALGRRLPDLD